MPRARTDQKTGLAEAEKRIEGARQKRAMVLDLGGLGLAVLPEAIGQLTQLQGLNLTGNRLTALPEAIGQLTQLQGLFLGDNQLTALPEAIGQLTQLQELDLSANRLTALPEAIGQLTQLQTLYLGSNRLTALPEAIGQLAQLLTLSLSYNQLTALPEAIGQLTQLQELNLSGNRFTTLPDTLARLKSLAALYLHSNPDLLLPPEALGPTWDEVRGSAGQIRPANPQTILAAYRDTRSEQSRPMCEAKLLLVGQGRVGKTSLVRYLVTKQKCQKGEEPTLGIGRVPWQREIKPPSKRKKQAVTLNVWDFGGQEIMHATHQFFLTKRSLYLLVLDAGTTEAENNLTYWLKVIRSFGGDAPVLVVVNKVENGVALDLNETRLKKDFPNIKGFYRVSCCSGTGIKELEKAIDEQIGQLPHVFDLVSPSFFKIKQQLRALAERKKCFIEYAEYEELCTTAGVRDEADRNRFLRFLHDLGIALNFDDPDDPYKLRDTNVLDPEWVTDAVYRIITSAKLKEARGVLVRGDLGALLENEQRFPQGQHEFILELMRKFELCFDFPDSSGDRFLVPERLGKDEPNVGWDAEDSPNSLNFQIKYDVLPPGLVCRFIVKMHTYLKSNVADRAISPTYWRDGAVLHVHKNRCLVRGGVDDRRIFIQVQGSEETRREALAIIREKLAEIHRTIKELKATELVPVPGQPRVTVEHATLIRTLRKGIDQFLPDGAEEPVSARELLERVDTQQRLMEYGLNGKPTDGGGGGKSTLHLGERWSEHEPKPLGNFESRGVMTPVDFGIITMKEEEYQAVEKRFEPVDEVRFTGRRYLLSRVDTPHGVRSVLIARCLEQGQTAAQQCARDLLEHANPRWLLLVGIAGGFPAAEYTLGDVLLASRVYDFAVTAALEDRADEISGKGGPVHRWVAELLEYLPSNNAKKQLGEWNGGAAISIPKPALVLPAKPKYPPFYGDAKWRKKVRDGLVANFPQPRKKSDRKAPRPPLYRTEPIVTANVLVKSPELVKRWKTSARAAAHVEMELGGVYEATQRLDKPVLSIRGLSDIVGYERSSTWTEYACQTAAAFARAVVGSGLLDNHRSNAV